MSSTTTVAGNTNLQIIETALPGVLIVQAASLCRPARLLHGNLPAERAGRGRHPRQLRAGQPLALVARRAARAALSVAHIRRPSCAAWRKAKCSTLPSTSAWARRPSASGSASCSPARTSSSSTFPRDSRTASSCARRPPTSSTSAATTSTAPTIAACCGTILPSASTGRRRRRSSPTKTSVTCRSTKSRTKSLPRYEG